MEEVSVEQRWIRECNFNGFFCEVLRKISKFWENEIQEGFEYQSILVFQTKIKVSAVLDYFKANLEIIQKFFLRLGSDKILNFVAEFKFTLSNRCKFYKKISNNSIF